MTKDNGLTVKALIEILQQMPHQDAIIVSKNGDWLNRVNEEDVWDDYSPTHHINYVRISGYGDSI